MEAVTRPLRSKVDDAIRSRRCTIGIEKTAAYWGTRRALSHDCILGEEPSVRRIAGCGIFILLGPLRHMRPSSPPAPQYR